MPIFSDADLYRAIHRELTDESARPQATPASPDTHVGAGPYATVIGGNAADLASTLYALKHGAHEANPALGNNPARITALKAAGTIAEVIGLRELAKSGHGRAARLAGYLLGAIPAGIAVHNLTTAQ